MHIQVFQYADNAALLSLKTKDGTVNLFLYFRKTLVNCFWISRYCEGKTKCPFSQIYIFQNIFPAVFSEPCLYMYKCIM